MNHFKFQGFVSMKLVIFGVIVGLGLIALLLAYVSAQSAARDKQRLADVALMQKALDIFFKANGFYPYGASVQIPTGMDTYVDHWPTAPVASGSCTAAQNIYTYSQKSSGADFALSFCLGHSANGFSAGNHVLTSQGVQ